MTGFYSNDKKYLQDYSECMAVKKDKQSKLCHLLGMFSAGIWNLDPYTHKYTQFLFTVHRTPIPAEVAVSW